MRSVARATKRTDNSPSLCASSSCTEVTDDENVAPASSNSTRFSKAAVVADARAYREDNRWAKAPVPM
jgi:hypothetical protein